MTTIALGFSPCPNDTFAFHGLVHGLVPVEGIRFEATLDDIEGLNQRALGQRGERLAVSKVSAALLPDVLDEYRVLRAGAALGRGCGPLVVVAPHRPLRRLDDLSGATVGIPGRKTTAHYLLRRFAPADVKVVEMRFDKIMPEVLAGRLDAGVVIHEGRFTFSRLGLVQIADLGQLWEQSTGLPLPLGVIVALRSLQSETVSAVETAIRDSVSHALAHPQDSWSYVRQHAQEMDEDVCRRHIGLYVNDYSVDLGRDGEHALEQLFEI